MLAGLSVWILLTGCDNRERTPLVTPALWMQPTAAVGVEGVASLGAVPHATWVRSVNGFGASVPSESASVMVDGNPRFVTFDALGYGTVVFEAPGRSGITADNVVEVESYAVEFSPPGMIPSAVAPLPDARLVELVTEGAVALAEGELWWTDLEGRRPHRVLSAPEPLQGMRVVQADVDAQLDVVTWTQSTVFLLRGRQGGGLAWGGALTATGYRVAGADMGDLSGDNVPDLAVAWEGGPEGTGIVDVWYGDGLFGFTAAEPHNLQAVPVSMVVADNAKYDQPQITVLHGDGTWSRFMEGAPGRYMPIGPRTPQSILPVAGSTLLPPIDINGDGADELHVASPFDPTAQRDIYLYDMVTNGLSALPLEDEPGAYSTRGDGDGNLVDDLFLSRADGLIQVLHFDAFALTGASSYPRTTVLQDAPAHGPVHVVDRDLDGNQDLLLAGPDVWWGYRGRSIAFDPARYWESKEPDSTFVREDLVGPFALAELDGDPASAEILSFHVEGSSLELDVLVWLHDDERAQRIGYLTLSGTQPVDLALCGQTAYALTSSTLHSIDLTDPTRPAAVGSLAVGGGRAVTCGTGPNGAAAALVDGLDVVLLGRGMGEVGRAGAIDAHDVAFVDVGAGPEARTCATEACSITGWTLADGTPGILIGDRERVIWFDAAGTGTTLGGRADTLLLADVDDDGVRDLLTHDASSGLLGLYRDLGGRVSRPLLWHSPLPWTGGIAVHDADLDGILDLWSVSDGDLRYVHPERATEPLDLADTGLPDTGLPDTGARDTGTITP